MDQKLIKYLQELKAYGIKNNIPNVTELTGQFLNMLIKIKCPKRILEIGCANGYSTIWMAEAAKKIGVTIYTIDHSEPTFKAAQKNITEFDFSDTVKFYFGDAVSVIDAFPSNLKFDFIFVDGEKRKYLDFFNSFLSRISNNAIIIFDDMIAFPDKTNCFYDFIKNDKRFNHILLPIDGDDGILILTSNIE